MPKQTRKTHEEKCMMEGFIKDWLGIIMSAIALGTVLFGWFTAGGKKAMTALDGYRSEVNAAFAEIAKEGLMMERRVQKMEDMMPHLPDRKDFHEMQLTMTRMEGRLNALTDNLAVNSKVVTKIDEYLRENGK
jgi:hypothetical protein